MLIFLFGKRIYNYLILNKGVINRISLILMVNNYMIFDNS